MRDLGVQIGKGIGEVHSQHPGKQMDVRMSAVHKVRCTIPDRPFHRQPGRGQPNRPGHAVAVARPIPRGDLYGARERAGAQGPCAGARQQRHMVDRFRVDRREESSQVERVEQPNAVKHHRRPFAGASPDIGYGHEVRRRRGRRRYRECPQYVGLQHRGQGPDHGGVHHEGVPRD